MADDASDYHLGFEEGLSWLPTHILHEACGDFNQEQFGQRARHYKHQDNVCGPEICTNPPLKGGRKNNNRAVRYGSNKTSGGAGMQAVFLEAGRGYRSCGTGVFLPRTPGTHFQPPNKPACSPVLLPSRVVHALNLNVQVLGLQISPKQDFQTIHKAAGRGVYCNKEAKGLSEHCNFIAQDQNCSPESFLPKEWSY